MNIEYLTQLLENKLKALISAKDQSFMVGDLSSINTIEQEILGVQNTLYSLKLLSNVNNIATSTNTTPTQIIESGIKALTDIAVKLDNPTGIIGEYDISDYATDPLHEQKILDILSYMGAMNSTSDIDAYINNESISSPLTGQMIWNSANKYSVDIRLMMALMELDSRFGTVGIAIATLNPGNVGNTDSGETRTYSSWEEGVDAVAQWLDKHRNISNILPEEMTPTSTTDAPTEENPPA